MITVYFEGLGMPGPGAAATAGLTDSNYLMLRAGHGLPWPWDCSAGPAGGCALA